MTFNCNYFKESSKSRLHTVTVNDRINNKNCRVSIIGVAKCLKPNAYMTVVFNHSRNIQEAYSMEYFNKNFQLTRDRTVTCSTDYLSIIKNNKQAKLIGVIEHINLSKIFDVYFYESTPNLLFSEVHNGF